MDPETTTAMSSAERELFMAMEERLRQLRRRRGIPNGVSLEEAIALHFVSADEVARARWGDDQPSFLRPDGAHAALPGVVPSTS